KIKIKIFMKNQAGKMIVYGVLCAVLAAAAVTMAGTKVRTAHADDATSSGAFVTFDSFSGPPGTGVKVTGGNFTPGEQVNISVGSISNAPVASSTARGDSLFGPAFVTIPANAAPGPLAIVAV